MTRNDARMIAEELFAIIKREGLIKDELMGVSETAQIMGCSKSAIYHKIDEIPHAKVGKALRFKRSEIIKYIER